MTRVMLMIYDGLIWPRTHFFGVLVPRLSTTGRRKGARSSDGRPGSGGDALVPPPVARAGTARCKWRVTAMGAPIPYPRGEDTPPKLETRCVYVLMCFRRVFRDLVWRFCSRGGALC